MRILVADIGSSSIKASVHDGRAFSPVARVEIRTRFAGHRVEIDPAVLLRGLFRAARLALAGAKAPIDAVAFCTFSPGVVVTAKDGRPTTAIITHADRRSTRTARE